MNSPVRANSSPTWQFLDVALILLLFLLGLLERGNLPLLDHLGKLISRNFVGARIAHHSAQEGMARIVVVIGVNDMVSAWLGNKLFMFLVEFTLDFVVVYVSIVIVVEIVEEVVDLFVGEVLDVLGRADGMVCYDGFAIAVTSHCRAVVCRNK